MIREKLSTAFNILSGKKGAFAAVTGGIAIAVEGGAIAAAVILAAPVTVVCLALMGAAIGHLAYDDAKGHDLLQKQLGF